MTSFHAGMTLEERRQLRDQILEARLRLAREEALLVHRSSYCRAANQMALGTTAWTQAQIAAEHGRCQAEALGGGCLDECHDAALCEKSAEPASP
jgi:hypothetical protein